MAFTLNYDTLDELGLAALPVNEKKLMLNHILDELEKRVGTNLASRMTETQLNEFEKLMPVETDDEATIKNKEQAALQWLEANFPDYKQVVSNELEKLKAEIKQLAPQILASSQQSSNSSDQAVS